ncbi:MAG: hypothetical protein ACI8RD_014300, partial [Bacillariaceae sp.]
EVFPTRVAYSNHGIWNILLCFVYYTTNKIALQRNFNHHQARRQALIL